MSVRLPADLLALVDAQAAKAETPRSQVIRELIVLGLNKIS